MGTVASHQIKPTMRPSHSQLELLVLERTSSAADPLPDVVETALCRVLQETLTNVHRHSGTSEI